MSEVDFRVEQRMFYRLARLEGRFWLGARYSFSEAEKSELLALAAKTPDSDLLAIRDFGQGLLALVRSRAPYRGITEKSRGVVLSDRELATVLAALRNWQTDSINEDLAEAFAGHFEEHKPLDDDEIDALCERLNLGAP